MSFYNSYSDIGLFSSPSIAISLWILLIIDACNNIFYRFSKIDTYCKHSYNYIYDKAVDFNIFSNITSAKLLIFFIMQKNFHGITQKFL